MNRISDSDLRDLLTNARLNRTGQYVADCPFCGKEKHFYISKATQKFDCKKCGESGGIVRLLKKLGKTYLLSGATVTERDNITSIRNAAEKSKEAEGELPVLRVRTMPPGWKIAVNSTPYLRSRGITPKDCERYKIGVCSLVGRYSNYVIIPIYDVGEIRGYIGRYGSREVPHGKLRYNNSAGTDFGSLLFGFDEITDKTETVVLVEGVFDKIAVDKTLDLWNGEEIKCVCTFGKKISDVQVRKLKSKGVSSVILLYDFDALKETKEYGLRLKSYFKTYITYTTRKDIDECSRDEALEVFRNLHSPLSFVTDVIGVLKR